MPESRISSQLAVEAHAILRVGNAASEVEIDRRIEEICAFLKERPLLRKENLKSLIDQILRLVRFQLAKIGIDGEIENQAVVDDHLAIEAAIGAEMAMVVERKIRITLIEIAKSVDDAIGIELNVAARRDNAQSMQL